MTIFRELSIRTRFLISAMTLVIVVLGSFALATHRSMEAVEREFSNVDFDEEFARAAAEFQRDGAYPSRLKHGYRAVTHLDLAPPSLRAVLSVLEPGVHYEQAIGDNEYNIGKLAGNGQEFYLLQDMESETLEVIEQRIFEIALWGAVTALIATIALSLWLSKIVIDPVKELASKVSGIVPGQDRPTPIVRGGGPELAVIGRALDTAFERFDAFAERERAFTRDASHELRTPLAVMRSGLEILANNSSTTAAHGELLNRMRSSVLQMQILIDALLALARTATGSPGPAAETFSIAELVGDAVAIQRGSAGRRQVTINLVVEHDQRLVGPPGMLLCVTNNLIRNAVEHSLSASVDVHVRQDSLVVQDHGQGIDAAILPRVFDRNASGPESRGEGLGLDLVRRICARQGWSLSLDTDAAHGTRFEVHYG